MALSELTPWSRARQAMTRFTEGHPFTAFQRDMNRLMESFWRDMELPLLETEGRSFLRPEIEMDDKDGKVVVTPGSQELTAKLQSPRVNSEVV